MKRLVLVACLFLAASVQGAVVVPQASGYQLLIPAAASTPGANGTFFKSDIAIVNLAPRDQDVRFDWLPQGGGPVAVTTLTITANTGIRSDDFVATHLGQTGVGSIVVSGLNSLGVVDLNAQLFISVRIWSPQPGTSGTTSQSLPAIPTNAVITSAEAVLYAVGGADNSLNYRVNVGIVNFSQTTQNFRITMPAQLGPQLAEIDVTIPAMSLKQVSLGSGLSPTQKVLIDNTTTTGKSNSWIAYGSTVDNVTGDAWSELAASR